MAAITETAVQAKYDQRTRPSLHLLAFGALGGVALCGYIAIIWSGELHGYEPSKIVAARDLALFIPIAVVFFWLIRRQKYRGEMLLLTTAVFLFTIGSLMQYRLFSDPEYGARGAARTRAREAKAQAIRLRNIETGYDDDKKKFLFGDAAAIPRAPDRLTLPVYEKSIGDILTSVNTYIPIAAFLALAAAFLIFKRDDFLIWAQRRSLVLGLAVLVPFAALVLAFSAEGKFLGQTTPWEPVKIVFLLSFAGALTASYRRLSKTRWGLPPLANLIPFAFVAALPVVPFFALSDFGQMMVFFGVYIMLYFVAVRSKTQLLYALMLIAIVFGVFFTASRASTGLGIPRRVYFRFYMWRHTWEPPPPETWWWKADYERYLRLKNLTVDPTRPEDVAERNREAWADKVLQQSQGLFGVNDGAVTGKGLGLGFPETVPISDSDFIYAALGEETGIVGALGVLVVFVALILGGISTSLGANDMFTKLLSAGLTAFIGFQAAVNVGGVLRLLPMTGITLPFVSHGGWSLITSFAMLGMLMAFSHRNFTRARSASRPSEPSSEFVAVH